MQSEKLEKLASIRAAVGYLGEKDQYGWWQSSFFSAASSAFISPLFPRTQFLAQFTGVSMAASRIHDERIGVGQVYHLFRLPEDIEQGLHRILHEPEIVQRVKAVVTSKDDAVQSLRYNGSPDKSNIGPTRVGDIESLQSIEGWEAAAAAYIHGFESGTEVFPYFADIK